MSADAKIWPDEHTEFLWHGIHDGECKCGKHELEFLSDLLFSIEDCVGGKMRWIPTEYNDGFGMRGFIS